MLRNKGFTLVELLVVIAIIALLMSILMPGLQAAREQAKMIKCRSNTKQFHTAATLFGLDNDDWTPSLAWRWPDPLKIIHEADGPWGPIGNSGSLIPYFDGMDYYNENGVFACPSAKDAGFEKTNNGMTGPWETTIRIVKDRVTGACSEEPGPAVPAWKRMTYGINAWLIMYVSEIDGYAPGGGRIDGGPADWWAGPSGTVMDLCQDRKVGTDQGLGIYFQVHGGMRMSAIGKPHDTVLFLDMEYYNAEPQSFDPFVAPWDLPIESQTRWHRRKKDDLYGKGNFVWVDGHASIEPSDMDSTDLVTPADPVLLNNPPYYRWTYYFFNH